MIFLVAIAQTMKIIQTSLKSKPTKREFCGRDVRVDFLFIDKRIGFLPRGRDMRERDVCEDKQIEFRIF